MTRSGKLVELFRIEDAFVFGSIDGVEHAWYLKGGFSLTFKSELDLIRITLRDSDNPSNKYTKAFADLPEGYDWLAMDENCEWFAYNSKIVKGIDEWIDDVDGDVITITLPPVKNWCKSLKRRQDYIVTAERIVNYPEVSADANKLNSHYGILDSKTAALWDDSAAETLAPEETNSGLDVKVLEIGDGNYP